MTKTAQALTAKAWTKPELVRLGKIADVAGPKVVSSNGASAGFAIMGGDLCRAASEAAEAPV